MEIIKKKLVDIKNGFVNGLPVIIVAIILYFSILTIFGVNEIIIVSCLTLLFKVKSKEEFSLKRLLELYCVLIIIAAFSFIANLNIVLCIVINLLLPSLLVYLYTDNFAPKGYFLYVMTFVLLELRPIQFSDLPRRFIVLSFGMSVVTIALLINSLIRKQKNNYESAQLGIGFKCDLH